MNTFEWLSRERTKADIFKSLSDCYYLPDGDLRVTLDKLERGFKYICEEAAHLVLEMKAELQGTSNFEPLTVDYARLFVGPYQLLASPYESVYLDGTRQVMGDSTLDVIKNYREAGIDINEEFTEPPDHIAAELEFIYFLIMKTLESASNSDFEGAVKFSQKQRLFLERHLTAWLDDFASDVEEHAGTQFYRNLAQVTKLFVRWSLDDQRSVLL